MTIVVAAASPDGVVFASDSRTTRLQADGRHRIASDYTRKLFAPFPGVGIATYGAAFIGVSTINGLVEEWVARRAPTASVAVDTVAASLARFFNRRLRDYANEAGQRIPPNVVNFLVTGYDGRGVGRIRELRLPADGRRRIVERLDVDTSGLGILWRGRTQYVRRLMEGSDSDALARAGVVLAPELRRQVGRLQFILQEPITLQDAVDAATFIVRMTIDMERLTDGTVGDPGGTPLCGGRVQALAVYRERAEWIEQPSLSLPPSGSGEAG